MAFSVQKRIWGSFQKYFRRKHTKCKYYHSLILGFPIYSSYQEDSHTVYECSYCGRVWKLADDNKSLRHYRKLRG